MGNLVTVNTGGITSVTGAAFTSADSLSVIINGNTYSVTCSTDAATSYAAFVTANGVAITQNENVYVAANGGTSLLFYNTDGVRSFVAGNSNTTKGARSEGAIAVIELQDSALVLSSATVIAYLNNNVPDGYDVATFTFASASIAVEAITEVFPQVIRNGLSRVSAQAQDFPLACVVTFA